MEKYFINIKGQQQGPFTKHQILTGNYSDDTMVYSKSIGKWVVMLDLRSNSPSEQQIVKPVVQSQNSPVSNPVTSNYSQQRPSNSGISNSSQQRTSNPVMSNDILDSLNMNFEYASWGERFGARILDVIFMIPIVILPSVLISAAFGGDAEVMIYLFLIIGMWLYFAIQESGKSNATWGKKILKIEIVNESNLSDIDFGKASGRFIFKEVLFSIIPLLNLVNFLFPLWDKKNQTLHDKTVKTIVIKSK